MCTAVRECMVDTSALVMSFILHVDIWQQNIITHLTSTEMLQRIDSLLKKKFGRCLNRTMCRIKV